MTSLRVGTRGSELALRQTQWVCDLLRTAHPSLSIEQVIIKTHGDVAKGQLFGPDWPVGGFVGAIEQALLQDRIAFAVHSYKDLQTTVTPGLIVAAVPAREVVHDVLVTRKPVELRELSRRFRVGTSSPRRAAQLRRFADVEIVPIRGNVPTRIDKLQSEGLDGVVLAAAGLKRLGLDPPHRIELPMDRFVPAPAQGALAIQARVSDPVIPLIAEIEHEPSRVSTEAERAFLHASGAGCHTPIGALAVLEGRRISLQGQFFSDDGRRMVEGREVGDDPQSIGRRLADRLIRELGDPS